MRKIFITAVIAITLCFGLVVYGGDSGNTQGYELSQLHVALRNIGHDILRMAGDSTSRLMPVLTVNEQTYEIALGVSVTFETDELRRIVDRHLAAKSYANYIVNVIDCNNPASVVYAYELDDMSLKSDVCTGRIQEKGNYKLQVMFPPKEKHSDTLASFTLPLAGCSLMLIGFLIGGLRRNNKSIQAPADLVQIGSVGFSATRQVIVINGNHTTLSDKETRIFSMLVKFQNEVLERDVLMKEIWESEGVFVGRSLDVFVSKLRKKPGSDAGVKIVSVHGRGYRLVLGH